ncbi:Rz1-like lysis system protein LysC [Serratia nevei]|uniref:Rz1-like lysis system protein LysC n=1 Tax=Serratia TaxID=613 RepID=UPI003BEEB187
MLLPPESVFTPCEEPTLQGDTWGDALSYTLALQTSLQICAGQVEKLNTWRFGIHEYQKR